MKEVTKFEANDGKIFESKDKCAEYESMLLQTEIVMSFLKPRPDDKGCSFSNGGGYIQQESDVVCEAMRKIVQISGYKFEDQKEKDHFLKNPFMYRNGIIGRVLSDGDNCALYGAWIRFMCIDGLFREWGQPYYASHPESGKQKEE
jgi:hypothetical protein